MTTIPFGFGSYKRIFGKGPEVKVQNRFLEQNPTNQVEQVSLLSRPGTSLFQGFGTGPIRALHTQAGAFGGDLFIVSNQSLFRYDGTTTTPITGTIQQTGTPSMTIVAGADYEHLFIADGQTLQFYAGISSAKGTLTVSGGNINDGDEIKIDTVHYQWTSGSVDAGTPDGTAVNPFLVNLGASDTEALDNMLKAINASGVSGTDYSTAIASAHTTVEALASSSTTLDVEARSSGSGGNSIATTVETGANISWGAATLEGGGNHALSGVATPDDVGIVSVATLASHVIAVVADSQRFYWIEPGAIIIDALNFAEAESEPDQVIEVLRVGDEIRFFGQSSTEAWYATGDLDAPFLRVQGRVFSRGVVSGTPVLVKGRVVVVGSDGIVYAVGGSSMERLSTNTIEERVRIALKKERENG